MRKCGTQQFRRETASELSAGLREALEPLSRESESLNERIQEYDRRIAKMATAAYPEVELLKQVKGVGDLIAMTYCADHRRPTAIPEKSRCWMLCRAAAGAEELRRE